MFSDEVGRLFFAECSSLPISAILAKMGNLQLSPGSLFANRFAIERAAGSGGMGTVYLAMDRHRGDRVALKLLHAGVGSSDEAVRFLREAQLLSELRHPGIVAHVAHGQTPDGQRFLAMEWLEGEDLGQRLLKGPLSVLDCLRLLEQVAEALAVAHQRGIIHRDLKPSNLFLVAGDVGRIKLLDFGIARRIQTSHAMTRTGMVVGTPEYMAPEQARGSRDLTPAADLFSLGCVLYECLTGQPPFAASHIAAMLVRILFEEPVPVDVLRPGLPAALSELLHRLLAKAPEQRVADAAALRAELLRIGELPDPSLAATIARPASKESFSGPEQSLFSIVLAAPAEADLGQGATLPKEAVQLPGPDRQALVHALGSLGIAPDFLANGTLVLVVPPMDSAQDQAILAARAALIVQERWPDSTVAMATGRGAFSGHTAFGDVVERAARSLQARSPGILKSPGVLVDALSAKLLAGRFAQTPQPDGAVLRYEARDEDASLPLLGRPTPCVGRDTELGILEGMLNGCRDEHEARVVLVTAPPGVGKSRLRHEFLRRVDQRGSPVTTLLGRGDMMSAGAPYGILADALRRLCGLTARESSEEQRRQLRARIGRHLPTADAERVTLFIGELSGVQFPEDGALLLQAARRDPKVMRDCLHDALRDFLVAECAVRPVLLALDDFQWGDGLTVSAIDEMLRELQGAPLLVLAFARPEIHSVFPKLWSSHGLQDIPLRGLSKKACERLIEQVLGKGVAPELLANAVEQSGGNALFLEEIIRSIADGKLAEQPETVVAMLQARIGRLAPGARQAVRAASVFGQTFWSGGVAAILGLPKTSAELQGWLAALVDAELIQVHGKSRLTDEKEYGFRHALVRDATCGLLSGSALSTGHRLAAEYLEQAGFDDLSIIAEHYDQGGERARALPFFVRAAQQSYEQYAFDEMLRRAERGLACEPTGEQLGILRAFQTQAAVGRGDWVRVEALGTEALGLLAPGSPSWCSLIPYVSGILSFTGQTERAELTARKFVAVEPAPEARTTYLYSAMYFVVLFSQSGLRSTANMVLSRMEQVAATLEKDDDHLRAPMSFSRAAYLRSYEPDPHGQLVAAQEAAAAYQRIGNLREACICGTFIGQMQCEAGDLLSGETTLRQTLAMAKRIRQLNLITSCELHLAAVLAWRQESAAIAEAAELLEKVLDIPSLSVGFRGWAHGIRAQLRLLHGNHEAAAEDARRAIDLSPVAPLRRLGAVATLSQSLLHSGRTAEAHQLAEEGLRQAESLGGGGYSELPLRLVAAEARDAVGDRRGARALIQIASTELSRRASLIPDQAARQRFLTQLPEHARIISLVEAWRG